MGAACRILPSYAIPSITETSENQRSRMFVPGSGALVSVISPFSCLVVWPAAAREPGSYQAAYSLTEFTPWDSAPYEVC